MNPIAAPSALRKSALSLFAAVFVLAGCKKEEKPAPVAEAPKQATPVAQTQQKPLEPRVHPECASPIDLAPPQELKLGERTATRAGYKLTFAEKDADGTLALGVLGPINEETPANLQALGRYVKFFKDEKVDAIVVNGDAGETTEGITKVLAELAGSGLPTFVVIGNREGRADYTNGVLEAQKAHPNVVNLNQVRVVEFPEATLVSLPGYHNPEYMHSKDGCLYVKSTVEETLKAVKEAKSPAVLISHGPPRGNGSQALDYATSGGNIGDAEINRILTEGNVPFGIFSNVKEAGARAVDSAEGTTLVAQDKPAKRLFLNPGPADTVGWKMNDETQSVGMAAVLRVKDGEGSWKLFRSSPQMVRGTP